VQNPLGLSSSFRHTLVSFESCFWQQLNLNIANNHPTYQRDCCSDCGVYGRGSGNLGNRRTTRVLPPRVPRVSVVHPRLIDAACHPHTNHVQINCYQFMSIGRPLRTPSSQNPSPVLPFHVPVVTSRS
jgi:hypothetical protein